MAFVLRPDPALDSEEIGEVVKAGRFESLLSEDEVQAVYRQTAACCRPVLWYELTGPDTGIAAATLGDGPERLQEHYRKNGSMLEMYFAGNLEMKILRKLYDRLRDALAEDGRYLQHYAFTDAGSTRTAKIISRLGADIRCEEGSMMVPEHSTVFEFRFSRQKDAAAPSLCRDCGNTDCVFREEEAADQDIRSVLEKGRLIADGAMGTYYDKKTGGGRLCERANRTDPDTIRQIHLEYLQAGARLIRTNTFAVNPDFIPDEEEAGMLIDAGWRIAQEAVRLFRSGGCSDPVFIAADMGAFEEDETRTAEEVSAAYVRLSDRFIGLGAKVFVFETLSDDRYIQEAVKNIRAKVPEAFIIEQFSIGRSGFTNAGRSLASLFRDAARSDLIDAVGLNCGIGPAHMAQLLGQAVLPPNKFITALPNAGYPLELRGKMVYKEDAGYFIGEERKIADLGVDILGGCCGTTPAHIRALHNALAGSAKPARGNGQEIKMPVDLAAVCSDRHYTPFMKKLAAGEKVFAVELDPPFDQNDTKLMNGIALMKKSGADIVTLADSPLARPRADSVAAAVKAHYTIGMEMMPHICCRDKNTIALRAQFLGMSMNGLRHTLLVTGDPVIRGDRERIRSVFNFNSIKLMEYLKTMNQEIFPQAPIFYGGALNQNTGSPDIIARRMQRKMEAGASWFMTQPVFSQEGIARLAQLREMTGARILAGIMPLVSRRNALFMQNEMPGIEIPDSILQRYPEEASREEYEQAALQISLELIDRLRDCCDGYYLMTPFNRTGLIRNILLQAKEIVR